MVKPQDIRLGKIPSFSAKGYIGIVWEDLVKKGDVAALIKGVRVPVLLRRAKQEFQLKDGFAYGMSSRSNRWARLTDSNAAHGIMDGELMADMESGKLNWQEIEIR